MFNNAGKEVFFAGDTEDHSGALRLADAAGNQTIALTSRGGGGVLVKDGAGNPVASLASAGAGRGGVFEVLNGQGNPALSLDTNATGGGRMVVSTAGGNPAVVADAGNAGGTVSTYLSDRRVAAMGATETGGVINLLDLNGQVVVSAGMSSDGVGGVVSTRNLRGVSVTRLGVDGVSSGELAVFNSTGTHKKVISAPVPGKTP